jgi:biopolymer transport protein ExbD
MADIQVHQQQGKRRRYGTPRVDLTPMVDLGFLLITFFMYTTTLARPATMDLQVPDKHGTDSPTPIPGEATIVVIPAAAHHIAWYSGLNDPNEKLQWCDKDGGKSLRSVLMRKGREVAQLPSSFSAEAHKLHVLIKPDTSADYADVISVLDEMLIAAVPSYSIVYLQPAEQEAIKKSYARSYGK